MVGGEGDGDWGVGMNVGASRLLKKYLFYFAKRFSVVQTILCSVMHA